MSSLAEPTPSVSLGKSQSETLESPDVSIRVSTVGGQALMRVCLLASIGKQLRLFPLSAGHI